MTRDDDIKRRTKGVIAGGDAVARLLEVAGIKLPDAFHDADALTQPRRDPAPTREHGAARPSPASRRERLQELGWPARALDVALDGRETRAIAAVRAWNPKHAALVLAGPKGTGKTVGAAWAALHWASNASFRFARSATLLRLSRFDQPKDPEATRDARRAYGVRWPEKWSDVIGAPALCLDDLGAEYLDAKGSFVADMDELIDTFYGDRRPLIITTNLDARGVQERYGSRVFDRLNECASWQPVVGESLRTHEE